MQLGELTSLLPTGTGWSIVALFLFLVFGAPALFSTETLKTRFSGLDALRKWWERRELAAIEHDQEVDNAVKKAMDGQVATMRQMLDTQRKEFNAQIDQLREEISRTRKELDGERELHRKRERELANQASIQMDYILATTEWARRVTVWATDNGLTIPPPKWIPYYEWLASVDARNPPSE